MEKKLNFATKKFKYFRNLRNQTVKTATSATVLPFESFNNKETTTTSKKCTPQWLINAYLTDAYSYTMKCNYIRRRWKHWYMCFSISHRYRTQTYPISIEPNCNVETSACACMRVGLLFICLLFVLLRCCIVVFFLFVRFIFLQFKVFHSPDCARFISLLWETILNE